MRLQVIIVEVNRNDKALMKELWRIPAHLKTVQRDNYVVLGSVSGSSYLSLSQLCRFYLEKELVDNPLKAFYGIMNVFLESKKIKSGEIMDLAVYNDFQRLGKGLNVLFRGKPKEEIKEKSKIEESK